MVNGVAETAVPAGFVTVIGPVTAVAGTTTASCEALTKFTVAGTCALLVPAKVTFVVPPCTERLVPAIDTTLLLGPAVGVKLVIVGEDAAIVVDTGETSTP